MFTSEEDATTSQPSRWARRSFSTLARRPYGAAAFKVSPRAGPRVAQPPVGAVTLGVIG